MTAPTIAKQLRFTGSLASPICHDLSPEVGILSSRASPNFRVGPRLIARNAVIRVDDEAGSVIETHEHKGDFKESWPTNPMVSVLVLGAAAALDSSLPVAQHFQF